MFENILVTYVQEYSANLYIQMFNNKALIATVSQILDRY